MYTREEIKDAISIINENECKRCLPAISGMACNDGCAYLILMETAKESLKNKKVFVVMANIYEADNSNGDTWVYAVCNDVNTAQKKMAEAYDEYGMCYDNEDDVREDEIYTDIGHVWIEAWIAESEE